MEEWYILIYCSGSSSQPDPAMNEGKVVADTTVFGLIKIQNLSLLLSVNTVNWNPLYK